MSMISRVSCVLFPALPDRFAYIELRAEGRGVGERRQRVAKGALLALLAALLPRLLCAGAGAAAGTGAWERASLDAPQVDVG